MHSFNISSFFLVAAVCLSLSLPASAVTYDFNFDFNNQEDNYQEFLEEMGIALSYPALDPAASKGILDFDVGIDVTYADIPDIDSTQQAFDDNDVPSGFPLTRVSVSKGLPFNTQVDGFLSTDPTGDVTYYGVAGKYAFIPGGALMPTVATRVSATRLDGVSKLDLDTVGVDLTVSKGFGFIWGVTPYAGVSAVRIMGDEHFTNDSFGSHTTTEGKYYVGSRIDLPLFLDLTVQYDGAFNQETKLYSIKGTIGL